MTVMDPNLDPACFPLLLPYGTPGYSRNLPRATPTDTGTSRVRIVYCKENCVVVQSFDQDFFVNNILDLEYADRQRT